MTGARMHLTALLLAVLSLMSFTRLVLAEEAPLISVDITPDEHIIVDENGDFTVPVSTRVVWTVRVTVSNSGTNTTTFDNVVWSNNYDAALEFEQVEANVGYVDYSSPSPPAQIAWEIGTLTPGDSAQLNFQLATRVNNGGNQEYSSENNCAPWESGAKLHYHVVGSPGNRSIVDETPRQRCVVEQPPWVEISLTTRKDWRLRRPGCFASEAARIEIASNDSVTVSFEDFQGLTCLDDPAKPSIPTWYSWGADLLEAESIGWLPPGLFNGTEWKFGPSEALEAGITETLWNRLCIGWEHSSSDYEDEGFVTIVLRGGSTFVAP